GVVLFQQRDGAGQWEELNPTTGYQGGKARPYQKWFLGDLAITGPTSALAVLFRGLEEGGAGGGTTDGGQTWDTVFPSEEEDLYRVRIGESGAGWLAGNHGSLWKTKDRGEQWKRALGALPGIESITGSDLAVDRSGQLGLAPLWNGKILMMTDGK